MESQKTLNMIVTAMSDSTEFKIQVPYHKGMHLINGTYTLQGLIEEAKKIFFSESYYLGADIPLDFLKGFQSTYKTDTDYHVGCYLESTD